MKTIQMSVLATCVLLLAGAADAQTVTIQQRLDYNNNNWVTGIYFAEPGVTLDHDFCLGALEDWGWTHNVQNSIPAGATGIASARLKIIAWQIDVETGEDDMIYVVPTKPANPAAIPWTGTELGMLKSWIQSPITVSWVSSGEDIAGYEERWSVTTFDLPAEVLNDLWTNGQLYFYMDIDQTLASGMRATLESSTLQVTYLAPTPTTPTTVNVHRFWSPIISSHFYTASQADADLLIQDYADTWTYEGIAYRALPEDTTDPLAKPVYRFWSPVVNGHFYTISDEQKQYLLDNYEGVWTYEGVAFYAYPEDVAPTGTYPVYRFWSPLHSHHFYTMSEVQKQALLDQYTSDVWTYEGIAWYAYPSDTE